jgi:hypothetical protein
VLTTLLSKLLEASAGGALDGLKNHGPGPKSVRGARRIERGKAYLNGLGIKLQTLLLVGEELLDIFALVTLKLGRKFSPDRVHKEACHLPNFFLMTLRIFFWSNFFGRPWTVVRVLRPLRSIE